jgi:hypothetical protein
VKSQAAAIGRGRKTLRQRWRRRIEKRKTKRKTKREAKDGQLFLDFVHGQLLWLPANNDRAAARVSPGTAFLSRAKNAKNLVGRFSRDWGE